MDKYQIIQAVSMAITVSCVIAGTYRLIMTRSMLKFFRLRLLQRGESQHENRP